MAWRLRKANSANKAVSSQYAQSDSVGIGCVVPASVIVFVSPALLLAGVVSVTLAGAVTVAVWARDPVAAESTVKVIENVTDPPDPTLRVVLRAPLPLEGPETLLAPVTPVRLQLPDAAPEGSGADTVAPTALEGPLLLTTMVYVDVPPAVTVGIPSVVVMDRSAACTIVFVSPALLLAGVASVTLAGAVTVAVWARDPVAAESTVKVIENVTDPPDPTLTVVLRAPVPLEGPETLLTPVTPVRLQLPDAAPEGSGADAVAPTALEGPLLLTTMVYVDVPPAVTVSTPSVVVMDRSAACTIVSVSLALLLAGAVSVSPAGAVTVAVWAREPVAAESTVKVIKSG
jgi:hypothetical protein